MSRFSRFDRLEKQRAENGEKEEPRPSLQRFEADQPAPPAPAADALEDPSPQPPVAAAPAPLGRFEADGGQLQIRLEEDQLGRLPFRRCAACERDNGKWDTVCYFCRAPLTSPETIALNLELLEAQDQSRSQEANRQTESNVKQILEVADEMLRKEKEAEKSLNVFTARGIRNVVGWVLVVGFFIGAFAVRTSLWTFVFLGLGILTLGLKAPGILGFLNTRISRRGW